MWFSRFAKLWMTMILLVASVKTMDAFSCPVDASPRWLRMTWIFCHAERLVCEAVKHSREWHVVFSLRKALDDNDFTRCFCEDDGRFFLSCGCFAKMAQNDMDFLSC